MQQRPVLQDEGGSTSTEKRYACTATLYERYAPVLFEYIRHHTAALNDAEDILTEVFIGALRQDMTKMSADEQRAWLWTVARNKVTEHYRRVRRQQQVSVEALRETLGEGIPPANL